MQKRVRADMGLGPVLGKNGRVMLKTVKGWQRWADQLARKQSVKGKTPATSLKWSGVVLDLGNRVRVSLATQEWN